MPEETQGYKLSQPKQSLAEYQNMGALCFLLTCLILLMFFIFLPPSCALCSEDAGFGVHRSGKTSSCPRLSGICGVEIVGDRFWCRGLEMSKLFHNFMPPCYARVQEAIAGDWEELIHRTNSTRPHHFGIA